MSNTQKAVEEKLKKDLEPTHLDIVDTSDGCGAKFFATIVSQQFEGKPLLQRHRMVNDIIAEELKIIHAFQMKTLTPEQWAKQQEQN